MGDLCWEEEREKRSQRLYSGLAPSIEAIVKSNVASFYHEESEISGEVVDFLDE